MTAILRDFNDGGFYLPRVVLYVKDYFFETTHIPIRFFLILRLSMYRLQQQLLDHRSGQPTHNPSRILPV